MPNVVQSERNIQRESDNITQSPQSDIQRPSDISVADNISEGDRNIQRESLTDVDITQSTETDIQRQADISNFSQGDRNIQSESLTDVESPQADISNVVQGDRNIQSESLTDVDISQSPQADIQRQADIPNVVQGDRNIQRETLTDLESPQTDIQRQADISNVSQGDRNIQRETLTDLESPQIDIQRQADISNVSRGDLNIQREILTNVESPQADISNVSQGDLNIQRESLTELESSQTDIQRQADISNVSQGDRNVQRESLTELESPQADISNVVQGDRNIQRESDNITQSSQSEIQRQSDVSVVSDILQGDLTQQIQKFSDLPVLDSDTQIEADNITQAPQSEIQRQIVNSNLLQGDTLNNSEFVNSDRSQLIQRKVDSSNHENPVGKTENQTVIQMMTDPSNTADLKLPKVIENIAQTEYLGNFSALTPPQTVQRSQADRPESITNYQLPINLAQTDRPSQNDLSNNLSKIIQPKQEQNPDSNQTDSSGWANIAELLANLPPPPSSNNSSASSLNSQKTSDRSSLATKPATIQRSPDPNYTDNANDQDLYITPKGLQKGNPNKITKTQSNTVQRELTYDTFPEATVSVETRQDQPNQGAENFDKNLETLAQEIYILLKQRLEIEKERQGARYQGRLPW
ncbi:hypothetical protein APA_1186 [Pseudanabaena sp. lw0831]|nr:hypothetical protein APA_1186 [Pseudanabaena sp. lw0831]